jgi:hypothetical protein
MFLGLDSTVISTIERLEPEGGAMGRKSVSSLNETLYALGSMATMHNVIFI